MDTLIWIKCQLAGKMKTTVNDPRLQDLTFEQAELSLNLIVEEETKTFSRYTDLLGLSWSKEDIIKLTTPKEGDKSCPNRLTYPLSIIIKPDFIECLKSSFGLSPNDSKDGIPEGATSLTQVSKEEFIARMGGTRR
jgi:hypothetical protein